jgi:tripartite ATP-independent transporter DctM subunit
VTNTETATDPGTAASGGPGRFLSAGLRRGENVLAAAALAGLALLPVTEMVLRSLLNTGIVGVSGYVEHLTLWVAYLGAVLAAREDRLLALTNLAERWPGRAQPALLRLAAMGSTAVAAGLLWAAVHFVVIEMANPTRIGGWLPIWAVQAVMPLGFGLITLRLVLRAGRGWPYALAGLPLAALVGWLAEGAGPGAVLPLLAALAALMLLGAPIFVLVGGVALLLFASEAIPVAAISIEAYRITASPILPAIPLFTLAGYLLTESGAGARVVRLFRALFAWMPGGLAVMTVLVCAFFSSFAGASGVLILAVGGLLLPALTAGGYPERVGIGLVTGTGSTGLLLPPSLAVILFAVVAQVSILDLFVAGIVPAGLMILAACGYGIWAGRRYKAERVAFEAREAVAALWAGKWELLIPVVALVGIFGGFTTFNEAAALTAVYVLVVEAFVHREVGLVRDLPRVLVECATLVGGVFLILGVAMGLTSYLVDAQVPDRLAAWAEANVSSRLLFLLALNLLLLLVGCLMDIFSAIAVVVPLLLPISAHFGISPLHLGVIFIANLELGYLTPPVGMNLFLAAYRFERPLPEICRSVLPILAILFVAVLAVTYLPLFIPFPALAP